MWVGQPGGIYLSSPGQGGKPGGAVDGEEWKSGGSRQLRKLNANAFIVFLPRVSVLSVVANSKV